MTDFANQIDQATSDHIRSGASDTSAADLRAVFGEVSAAVRFLQGLAAGNNILVAAGPPGSATGKDGDVYLNTASAYLDAYQKQAGAWGLPFAQLKGKDGRTPRLGVDYQDGRTPVFGVDYHNGVDGKSAYELALATGFSGTLPQWLASLKAEDGTNGDPGAAGNLMHWQSYAPSSEPGNAGDAWFYLKSADKLLLYECYQVTPTTTAWRLRYTSPDAPTGTGSGSGGTANYPPQNAGTTGKYVKSSGSAGGESWDYPNRGTIDLEFLQLFEAKRRLFLAAQWLRFEKDESIASLSYQLGTAAAVPVPFPAGSNQYTPPAPISVPAGTLVTFTITYASSANQAFAQVFAAWTLPQL